MCPYDKDGFCEKNGWCNDRCMEVRNGLSKRDRSNSKKPR